ncbi:protein ovarian tumor locus-like isoform X2 [Diorhabda sublineata]|uniref:protein ovarian tumor locus-like isoform X2 n=1 Tax=Diorhabda sublineata TaxID=1163346 RepID=UPI0024E07AA9|nr:protein ovarian tumor locus-like isoform X2 [Diorhabda sublineata]
MYKIGKKGKNPTAVDFWLDTLGLYRKNVAYDETCLFRAISEQLFDCQIYHERVRRECLLFARENYTDFVDDESTSQFFHHLDKLEKHMVVCGEIELNIITKKYKKSITVFDATDQQIHHYSENEFDKAFLLCLMDRDHYDVVYKKEHIEAAGFCQSIVYKTLYENVFGIAKVDEIVHNMLYDKGNIITQAELMMEKKRLESENKELTFEELQEKFNLKNLALNIAPFPFKIAKALDPNIYRNIEYDSWGEMRREWRLGEWYHGDNKLILGTKCIYHDIRLNEKFDCYIQEMIKNENMCVIYLTKLAEKRTVKYTDLSPEDDAKPWPLPYRFSKSVIISPSTPPTDRILPKPKRRNRDKKRTKSETSLLSSSYAAKQDHPVDNIDAYIGIPLQIQYPHNDNITYCTDEMATELQLDQTTPISPNEIQENLTDDNSRWYQWQPYIQPQTDPFVWPTIPGQTQNVYNYNVKPMIASAPVTPSVIPYHEFKTWLETEEIMYGVQYARLTGWKKSFKHEKLYYDCARSGKQQTNKDKPKIRRGRKSFKLNRNCTSKIIITKHLNPDLYHVGYYRTHYGHSVDDTNKRIPKQQREEVVRSLKRGLSPTRILQLEAERDSLHRKKLKRRDINNIKRSLKQQIPATEETPRINDVIILVEEVNSANERESLLKEIESTALQIVTSSEGYDNGSLVLLLENLKSVAATVPPIDTEVAGGDVDAAADLKLLEIQ